MTQKILVQVLFVLSLLPLVIYPGILMAGIMGLAAERRGGASGSALVETVAKAFLYLSMLYPAALAWAWSGGINPRGAAWAIGYLAVCLALLGAWYLLCDKS